MVRKRSATNAGFLTARIADRLRTAILNGQLALGEALSEDRLAVVFGVSRTPVRDALTALQVQGLIEIKPQRGSFVFLPTAQDVVELSEIRSILEVQALRLSIVRKRDDTLRSLRAASNRMDAAGSPADVFAVARADSEFHIALVENSGNKYLAEAYRQVSGRVEALRSHVLFRLGEVLARSVSDHQAIVVAIENGNLTEAESILSMHIAEGVERFKQAVQDGLPAESAGQVRRSVCGLLEFVQEGFVVS